jgi:hypothetical protein
MNSNLKVLSKLLFFAECFLSITSHHEGPNSPHLEDIAELLAQAVESSWCDLTKVTEN